MKRHDHETSFRKGQALRVLLLENDPDDARLCSLALEKGGYSVRLDVVATATEFCGCLDSREYDIILADYQLPGWTGLKALELVKERGLEIPFVLVTGEAPEKTALEMIDRGADDYLFKDQLNRLVLTVRRVMREQRLMRERRQAALEKEKLIAQLREAAEEVRRLNGLLPICVSCKRILDAKGQWHRVELFIQKHSRGQVSPCVCPECSANVTARAAQLRAQQPPRRERY
jgi:CheY-like chemotaxis protein